MGYIRHSSDRAETGEADGSAKGDLHKRSTQFYYINSDEELREGTYGILEPITGRLAEPHTALVILPGTVFDIQCSHRDLGDRRRNIMIADISAAHRSYRTMALAYSVADCTGTAERGS